jgi:hypothetical protein
MLTYLFPTHPHPTQVLDARDPEGCRCPDVERYVRSLDPGKKIILLLNKMGEALPRAELAWHAWGVHDVWYACCVLDALVKRVSAVVA